MSTKLHKIILGVKIDSLIEHGRCQITTKNELEKYKIGSLISYVNKDNEFKTGGYITKFAKDYFIYVAPDFFSKRRVRYTKVKTMWVGDVFKTTNDIVSFAKSTQKNKTKFIVEFYNIPIYYATRLYDVKRFKNTDKYTNMKKWIEYFDPDYNF